MQVLIAAIFLVVALINENIGGMIFQESLTYCVNCMLG